MINEEDYPGESDDIRRASLIRQSLEAGDRILLEGTNGSREELDYLTAAVAKKWADKVLSGRTAALLAKDLELRSTQGEK